MIVLKPPCVDYKTCVAPFVHVYLKTGCGSVHICVCGLAIKTELGHTHAQNQRRRHVYKPTRKVDVGTRTLPLRSQVKYDIVACLRPLHWLLTALWDLICDTDP